MTKIKRLPRHHQVTIFGLGVLVLFSAATIVLLLPKKSTTPPTTTTDTSAVTITTSDGINLAATFKTPSSSVTQPAIILLHQYGQDRHEWDPYLQTFLDAGFAVLSYDMRGFGDSRLKAIPASESEHLKSLPNDVPAAIEFLHGQSSVDPEHISLIGASVGANTAYIANGLNQGIYRTVLLSPVIRDASVTAYGASNFTPQNILGLASETEKKDLDAYMKNVSGQKQEKIIPGAGHGVDLLSQPGVMDDILQWIK